MMDYPRFPISDVHPGKFPDSLEFHKWKVNFKTEVCANSAFPHITMHWVKKVEIAKSTGDLMTSQSTAGRRDITDYDMHDAMIASALKKLLASVHFRFLRGRHIAHMMYKHFSAIGAYEAVQSLSDFFNIRLHDDDVQDFDTRWDQALSAASEKDYTSQNYRILFSFRLYWLCMNQRIFETTKKPRHSRLKTSERRHVDQTMRTRNFRVRTEIVERGTATKSRKERKAFVERKVRECYQWKANGQCSKGDSCSFRHDPASGNRCAAWRSKRQSSSLAPKAKAQADGKKPSKSSSSRGESPCGTRGKIPCRNFPG